MTVICWDGVALAADKLALSGNVKSTVTKIFRVYEDLVGVCGNLSCAMETLDWYRAGAAPRGYPEKNRTKDEGANLIVVRPDKTVWKYESSPYPFQVEGPFCAFGSGDESALIAMECGCGAERAVEMAIKYNVSCGNGVDVLTHSA